MSNVVRNHKSLNTLTWKHNNAAQTSWCPFKLYATDLLQFTDHPCPLATLTETPAMSLSPYQVLPFRLFQPWAKQEPRCTSNSHGTRMLPTSRAAESSFEASAVSLPWLLLNTNSRNVSLKWRMLKHNWKLKRVHLTIACTKIVFLLE